MPEALKEIRKLILDDPRIPRRMQSDMERMAVKLYKLLRKEGDRN